MTDYLGALQLPVPAADEQLPQIPVGDPFLRSFGEFLAAAIRRRCQTAWSSIGGGTDVVERVETNDPTDNTFSTSKLPCMALWRAGENDDDERICDDVYESKSDITVRWIPQPAVQHWKANREAFSRAIRAAVAEAIRDERTPDWVVDGDTDPHAAVRGSCITTHLRLYRKIASFKMKEELLVIEMPNLPPKQYPSIKFTFPISEVLDTAHLGVYAPKLDAGIRANAPLTVATIATEDRAIWEVP